MRKRLVHIAAFDRNVGDNALNHAIETMLGARFDIERMELVGNPFDEAAFNRMNAADGVIFGGGGVIHSCSGGASRENREKTGTMWNMDLDMIRRLKPKIVLYSVGFNKFDGEPPPLVEMGRFFDVLAAKRALVSFRNDLSKQRFLDYFPRFGGIRVTPDPGLFCRGDPRPVRRPYALLQIATDRVKYRYPSGFEAFISLVNALAAASPVPVFLIPHTASDETLYRRHRRDFRLAGILDCKLAYADVLSQMELYRNASFTISTRGHSQICSIGNGAPTFALSTHPKARGFMEEIGQAAACFDYLNEDAASCLDRFRAFLAAVPSIREELVPVNARFVEEIDAFNRDIAAFIEDGAAPPDFVTDPDAVPKLDAVTLDGAPAPPPPGPGEKGEVDMSVAWLPGRTAKVGEGTFLRGRPLVADEVVETLPNRRRGLLRPSRRSSDGATCGVVVSCDRNYFPGLAGCIEAVRRYNPGLPVCFLDAGLTAKQAQAIAAVADDYARLDDLIDLDVATFPNHLNKAALSSLYVDRAPFDKTLYLDVDALVLGDLTPMFEALGPEHDIVGVRGSLFRSSVENHRHTVRDEIEPEAVESLERYFPKVDLAAPAINSGCFVVRRATAERWHGTVRKLLPFLRHFRTADQALLNVMITALGLRLKLFDPMFNVMGLQLTDERHMVQEARVSIDLTDEECRLWFGDRRIVVAHYAGRQKPWKRSLDIPASYAWDWHAPKEAREPMPLAGVFRLRRAPNEAAFDRAVDEMIPPGRRSRTGARMAQKAGDVARERRFFASADRAYRRAVELGSKSAGVVRGLAMIAPNIGRVEEAMAEVAKDRELREFDHPLLQPVIRQMAAANRGEDAPATAETLHAAVIAARAALRRGDREAAADAIAGAPRADRDSPEGLMLARAAAGDPPAAAAAFGLAAIGRSGPLGRRAVNAAFRAAEARLAAIAPALSGATGAVAAIGAGTGAFVAALARRLGVGAIAVDHPDRRTALRLPARFVPFADIAALDGKVGVLVLAHVADRLADFAGAAAALRRLLAEGGRVLVIDGFGEDPQLDLFEGLRALPPAAARPGVGALKKAMKEIGLACRGTWLAGAERLVLFAAGGDAGRSGDIAPLAAALAAAAEAGRLAASDDFAREAERHAAAAADPAAGFFDGDEAPDALPPVRILPPAEAQSASAGTIAHVAYFESRNLGDRVLCEQTRDLFAAAFPGLELVDHPVNRAVGRGELAAINRSRFVVIGGGGLIHSTSGADGAWQWAIAPDRFAAIDRPVILFGVGLNEFRGGDFYGSENFARLMRRLAEKSAFMGFRERRSCAIVAAAVPDHAAKVRFQPCAAFQLGFRYPALRLPRRQAKGPKRVAINVAFDRPELRYGGGFDARMRALDAFVARLLDDGTEVTVVAHTPEDRLFHALLHGGRSVGLLDLTGRGSATAAVHYERFDLVAGMRTHSQIIPFAVGVPILSIISHDKLAWALDDLGCEDWGVELDDTEFVEKATAIARDILADPVGSEARVVSRLLDFDRITRENLAIVREAVRA